MKITKLFNEFFDSEKAGGLILIFCTIISLIIANSHLNESYQSFWHQTIGTHTLSHWINDGLMTIFFLLIGLELEREVYQGELSNLKDALLPIIGAIGGMIVPALIYYLFNNGTISQSGIGIPMATDIAFALGILSLLGNKVPVSLKIFITALAVIDDLGAIVIIALFYSKSILFNNLIYALSIFLCLLLLNRLKIRNLIPYLIGGVFMWYFMMLSGVHATIAGILLAFAIPFGNGNEKSSSYILQHLLHKPVAFIILPLFALSNTAIPINASIKTVILENYSLGIALGLIVGKPLGIFGLTYLFVKSKFCQIPSDLNWQKIFAAACLAGIGFTMSIFITLLAFDNAEIINNAKLVIILSALISGILGFTLLKKSLVE